MKLLIAEDDPVYRCVLEGMTRKWDYDVTGVGDGEDAWSLLQQPDGPRLALLDWKMPRLEGVALCRRLRQSPLGSATYAVLLTAHNGHENIISGLESGADDYITKPFHPNELRARLQTGSRIVALQKALADRVHDLEEALNQVKQLQGLLPICSYCKMIRNDQSYWQQVESYIAAHTDARFSHTICPNCWAEKVQPELESFKSRCSGARL